MRRGEAIALKGCREGLRILISRDADIRDVLDSLHEKAREHKSFFRGTCNVIITGREFSQADKLRINSIMSTILPGCPVSYEAEPVVREERSFITRREREADEQNEDIEELDTIAEEAEKKKESGIQKTILKFIGAMSFDKDDYIDEDEEAEDKAEEAAEPVVDKMIEVRGKLCEDIYIYNGNVKKNCRLRAAGSLIIVGDTEPDSEVVAIGSVYVFGKLRGRIWAGCSGDEDAKIISYDLAPDEMRISDTYLRLPNVNNSGKKRPEKAYLKNGTIYIAEHF